METYRLEVHEIRQLARSGSLKQWFDPILFEHSPRRLVNVLFWLGFDAAIDCRDLCTPPMLIELATLGNEARVRWMMKLLPAKLIKSGGEEYWKITDWSVITKYFFNKKEDAFKILCDQVNNKERAAKQQKAREIFEFPNGTFSSVRQVAEALGAKNLHVAMQYLRDNDIIKNAEGFYVKSTDPSARTILSDVVPVEGRVMDALARQSFQTVIDLAAFVDASMAQTSRICKKLGVVKSPATGLLQIGAQ